MACGTAGEHLLVFEMSETGDGHAHVVFLAVVDGVLVVDGATGMGDSHDACLMGNFHTVGEGEEGIASHDGAIEVEAEALGLGDGLTEGVDTGGLTGAAGAELTVLGQHDGVTFGVSLRQHRTIRLRHLLENLCPDFVTFS